MVFCQLFTVSPQKHPLLVIYGAIKSFRWLAHLRWPKFIFDSQFKESSRRHNQATILLVLISNMTNTAHYWFSSLAINWILISNWYHYNSLCGIILDLYWNNRWGFVVEVVQFYTRVNISIPLVRGFFPVFGSWTLCWFLSVVILLMNRRKLDY